jgi:hypothetical protein
MLLYHGTSERHLDAILREGIRPRGRKIGNWQHTVTSAPGNVYLTSAYAIYFANCAAKSGDNLAVIEVDTAKVWQDLLRPDEDFLEAVTRKAGPAPLDKSMADRVRWYRKRLADYSHHWEDSVRELGTCSVAGPVPVSAITRIAVLPAGGYGQLVLAGHDPAITLVNYMIVGGRYRNFIRWLFGDPIEPDPSDYATHLTEEQLADMTPGMAQAMRDRRDGKDWLQLDRSGVTVTDVPVTESGGNREHTKAVLFQ